MIVLTLQIRGLLMDGLKNPRLVMAVRRVVPVVVIPRAGQRLP